MHSSHYSALSQYFIVVYSIGLLAIIIQPITDFTEAIIRVVTFFALFHPIQLLILVYTHRRVSRNIQNNILKLLEQAIGVQRKKKTT